MAASSESNTKLLEELETLSQTLYQSHISSTRRTASLVLSRPSVLTPDEAETAADEDSKPSLKSRARRMSLSPWRSGGKDDRGQEKEQQKKEKDIKLFDHEDGAASDKKGIWKWKPMRALSHIGMQKLSCLFSVEVVAAQGLPASMNGLRLSVCVRKKETKEGAVNTMPSRVSQGGVDFEETLFIKCHVYWEQVGEKQRQVKFEPRPFLIYLFAVDAGELDFGRSSVDLSRLIQESLEKNVEGNRIKQWDTSFNLGGKAKGGELLLRLAFQIMEKDKGNGTGLFGQLEGGLKQGKAKAFSTFGRKQSKSSFSIPSPKSSSRSEVWTPSLPVTAADIQGIDHLNLDEPAPVPETQKPKKEEELGREEVDLPDFEVVDKGVEIQNTEEKAENGSSTSEVVKEVVHDHFHLTRLTELDSIAQQIKALESMVRQENMEQTNEDTETEKLDADEETVTMEFLQMLEDEEGNGYKDKEFQYKKPTSKLKKAEKTTDVAEHGVFLSDLGKGLGSVVQTRNGGFLAAANPLNVQTSKTNTPKLAMQISRPFVVTSDKSVSGLELFQQMAAIGVEQLSSEVLTLMPIEELMGKTAEQIAFEGIASTIISGRKKEGASSSAARILASIKQIATAMGTGRKERISTGLWNVSDEPLTADEILAFSIQKIEAMTIEALKIQAEMAEEDAPLKVSPLSTQKDQNQNHPLASAIPLDDWIKDNKLEESETITLVTVVQLRDPLRRYEAVGGPVIVLIHTSPAETKQEDDEELKFRVASLHVGGMKHG
ncbi:Protein PLASTID MOVEMENT IMPAIRED 1 [Bienertia sinuspersici]